MNHHTIQANPGGASRAFTLAELLVVISIFVLVLAVAVPSFSSLVYSQERAQAENQLAIAMSAARSSAVSGDTAEDAAAVFFFDQAGRCRIGVYTLVGEISDETPTGTVVKREVFVPSSLYPSVALPNGWMVRGYAPPGAVDTGQGGAAGGWYEANPSRQLSSQTGNWVFPETSFFLDKGGPLIAKPENGRRRQSFMVRFQAQSGLMDTAHRNPVLVIDPVPTDEFRTSGVWGRVPKITKVEDVASAVRKILATRKDLAAKDRREMLGDISPDTILCRAVAELALYDERKLAAGIRARGINSATGSLYGNPGQVSGKLYEPILDTALFPAGTDSRVVNDRINRWLLGVPEDGGAKPEVRLFAVDRFQGSLQEVLP